MNKRLLGTAFLLIAVLGIIFAIICFNLSSGGYEWNETYGGDAYTGIQNAAAQTANNVSTLNQNIKNISGYAFLMVGLSSGIFGVVMLIENNQNALSTFVSENKTATLDDELPEL